eukprot:7344747-Prymnesium_polylepis.1
MRALRGNVVFPQEIPVESLGVPKWKSGGGNRPLSSWKCTTPAGKVYPKEGVGSDLVRGVP